MQIQKKSLGGWRVLAIYISYLVEFPPPLKLSLGEGEGLVAQPAAATFAVVAEVAGAGC